MSRSRAPQCRPGAGADSRDGYRTHPREMIAEIRNNGQRDWSHSFVVETGKRGGFGGCATSVGGGSLWVSVSRNACESGRPTDRLATASSRVAVSNPCVSRMSFLRRYRRRQRCCTCGCRSCAVSPSRCPRVVAPGLLAGNALTPPDGEGNRAYRRGRTELCPQSAPSFGRRNSDPGFAANRRRWQPACRMRPARHPRSAATARRPHRSRPCETGARRFHRL